MTDAVKKYREILAYCLLGVAALYLLSGLSLLFKDQEDLGLDFTSRAAVVGNVFAHPLLILALVLAIAVVAFGEPSRQARTVVLVALGIVGVALLLAVICWLSSLGSDDQLFGGGGVASAGKIVGALLGLAQLVFLTATALFAYAALQSLPKPATAGARGWSPQPAWGQPDPAQQGWGQPDSAQQGWGQYDANNPGYGQSWGQPGYAQPVAGQQGWAQPPSPQQGWGQPVAGQQDWGQPQAAQGWDPVAGQQTWQPAPEAQAEWAQPQQQWGAAPQTGGDQVSGGWGEQQPQQGWGQPPEPASSDETVAPEEPHTGATSADEAAATASTQDDSSGEKDQPGGWWQRPQQ